MISLKHNQHGFVTMIICIIVILAAIIYFTYTRVAASQ